MKTSLVSYLGHISSVFSFFLFPTYSAESAMTDLAVVILKGVNARGIKFQSGQCEGNEP